MTILSFTFIIITQLCAVTGQIFIKKSVNLPGSEGKTKSRLLLASGIASMTLGFFLWLGLMSKFDLSYLFPFEGIHYIFIVIAAGIFLKERASASLWLGVILIGAGVALVSAN
ncbi:MAG: EamA family transporter [Chthoniobacteraceae bacterium]